MKNKEKKHILTIEKQAYEWLAIMHSGQISTQDEKQFRTWLEADPRHKSIYHEVSVIWEDVGLLRSDFETDSYRTSPLSFKQKTALFIESALAAVPFPQAALVASLVIIVAIGGIFYRYHAGQNISGGSFATQTAELRNCA